MPFNHIHTQCIISARHIFTNAVRTDGFAVDFIFARSTSNDQLPDLDPSDFDDELNEAFELWGADPGLTYVFVVCNSNGTEPCEVRKISTVEYYTKAGFKATTREIHKKKIEELEQRFPGRKTANTEVFSSYLDQLFQAVPQLLSFYDHEHSGFRFLNHMGRQKMDAESVNLFVNGGAKYRTHKAKMAALDSQESEDEKKRRGCPRKEKVRKKERKWKKQATLSDPSKKSSFDCYKGRKFCDHDAGKDLWNS
ncbi:hypothetical protein DFQ29_006283 [Apophysomyces sp. BC1021]|nr:hypothetical protein DFQ29_006283 [Apophysomyces sp. BC1021]